MSGGIEGTRAVPEGLAPGPALLTTSRLRLVSFGPFEKEVTP